MEGDLTEDECKPWYIQQDECCERRGGWGLLEGGECREQRVRVADTSAGGEDGM